MTTTNIEIGAYLARLRDKAGLKQNELANRVTWSPAVLSRVESGERALSSEELDSILDAIGTEEALDFKETIERPWEHLPRPQLGHPDEAILWEAEQAIQSINGLSRMPDIPNAFARRLEEAFAELCNTASLISGTEYSVVFVGDIGVGKSTALCRIASLEVKDDTTSLPLTVLDTGAGGITLCEVHIAQGPGYGMVVEPRSEADLYREIREFARSFIPSQNTDNEENTENRDFPGTSEEIGRAIRNMSGLVIPRRTDRNQERIDPIDALVASCVNPDDLAVAIRAKMNLQKRTRRELWYPEFAGKEPLAWLAEIFRQVNNGRHPEFSLPNRMEVMVPQQTLGAELEESLSIRLVDTKGIDTTAERGDLEAHFNNPNAIVVLCSTFNDAPSSSVKQLLQRAVNGQFPAVETKSAVLVLPHPAQALEMRDSQGFAAESVDEGYLLKSEQAERNLQANGLPCVPIEFFNSREDDPQRLISFLLDQVNRLRKMNRRSLKEMIKGANALVQNHENEQVRAVQQQAATLLKNGLERHRQIASFTRRPEDSLLEAIQSAHPSSLRASIRRQGEWYNLDYSHQLSYGTRAMTANVVRPKLEAFKELANTLLDTTELQDASDLIQQSLRLLQSDSESLLNRSQLLGRTIYAEYLENDWDLWDTCENERGQGYRNRVYMHHKEWFANHQHEIDAQANAVIEIGWQHVIDRVLAILQTD